MHKGDIFSPNNPVEWLGIPRKKRERSPLSVCRGKGVQNKSNASQSWTNGDPDCHLCTQAGHLCIGWVMYSHMDPCSQTTQHQPWREENNTSTWPLIPQILLPLSFIFLLVPCLYTGKLTFPEQKTLIEDETSCFKMCHTNQFPVLQTSYSFQIWENETRHKFNTGSSRTDTLLGNRRKRMLEWSQIIVILS